MEISAENLRKHVRLLASPQMSGREFGSEQDRQASEYVRDHFREYGLAPPEGYPDLMQTLPWGGQNVLGILNGSDSELANECVIIDAHQDHMGEGFPGASENAAGIAIMLELARVLGSGDRPKRSLLFACFDGEESILMVNNNRQLMQGATYYVENPVFDPKRTSALLTLDTLGRNFLSGDLLFVLGLERSLDLQGIVRDCTTGLRKVMFSTDLLTGVMGNYLPFVRKRIPALFISNGTHQDYHGRGDTAEKISYELLSEDLRFLIELVARIANAEDRADFCKNPIPPQEEQDDVLYLLRLLKGAMSQVSPGDAGRFDLMIEKLRGKTSVKEMKRAVQILLGFATPNFARLYLLLNDAQGAEKKKNWGEALRHYGQILDLYDEYRVPYLWLQEIKEKVKNMEEKLGR
ncbi:MAG: M28 family metallopeptidase [Nitrososphaerales archaeon]